MNDNYSCNYIFQFILEINGHCSDTLVSISECWFKRKIIFRSCICFPSILCSNFYLQLSTTCQPCNMLKRLCYNCKFFFNVYCFVLCCRVVSLFTIVCIIATCNYLKCYVICNDLYIL